MNLQLILFNFYLLFICADNEKFISSTKSKHTNNWAVIVSASRFWFNYRHLSSAIGIYRTVKRLGIPDSNIILMLADDIACNPRNKFPGQVFRDTNDEDLYGNDIEVDYKGYDVTVENFVRVLTNRLPENVPKSKRLQTDENSNILVYLTGHGGENFLKFQDSEEITAQEIGDAFMQMNQKSRYNEILYIIDTCEANSLYSKIRSPNIISVGSSKIGEKSYSYNNHNDLGVTVVERLTHFTLEFMKGVNPESQKTLKELFDFYDPSKLDAHPGFVTDNIDRKFDEVLLMDFFGSKQNVIITSNEEEVNNTILTNYEPDNRFTPLILYE
ncbi:phosphatidylinositol glycan precursor [Neoconidiobolus thromboides FSU 785]|nr:phosphatidylinositol glycan precursor [Neoconidiobolus thromboides FSU 785]